MGKYYLLNGKNGKGNALDLLVDGKLRRDFVDISSLDKETMNIKRSEAKDVLAELNKDKDLDGKFYDALYPYKKVETKTFAPIFDFEGDEYKYYMDNLRYFAEQRDWKKQNGKKLELDQNRQLNNYIRTLCYNILKKCKRELIQYESLVPYALKEEFKNGFMSKKGADGFLNSRSYKISLLLNHYTSLRDLSLEYMYSIGGEKPAMRSALSSYSHFDNYGMEALGDREIGQEEKSDKEIKYYQMTLDQFFDMGTKK